MPDYSLFGDEHVRQYERPGGQVGHDWNGAHRVILYTTGREVPRDGLEPVIPLRAL